MNTPATKQPQTTRGTVAIEMMLPHVGKSPFLTDSEEIVRENPPITAQPRPGGAPIAAGSRFGKMMDYGTDIGCDRVFCKSESCGELRNIDYFTGLVGFAKWTP